MDSGLLDGRAQPGQHSENPPVMEWLHIALIGVLIVIALVAARLLNFLGRGADAGHSRAAREHADGYSLGGYTSARPSAPRALWSARCRRGRGCRKAAVVEAASLLAASTVFLRQYRGGFVVPAAHA